MSRKTKWGLFLLAVCTVIGVVVFIQNASNDTPAIDKADIVYETPDYTDYTESFEWYKRKLRRSDFKVLVIPQEGVDVDLKWATHSQSPLIASVASVR